MRTHSVQKARQCCTWWLWAQVHVVLPRLWEILVISPEDIINSLPAALCLSAGWSRQAGFWRQPAPRWVWRSFFPYSAELFLPVYLIQMWMLFKMFVDYKLHMSRVRSKSKQWNKRAMFKGCIFRTRLSAYVSSWACNHQQLRGRGDTDIIILVYKPSSE